MFSDRTSRLLRTWNKVLRENPLSVEDRERGSQRKPVPSLRIWNEALRRTVEDLKLGSQNPLGT
jgi:hypothetical protein